MKIEDTAGIFRTMQRMPLNSLELFFTIAKRGSVRAAAAELNLQPSTVSHQLRALEQQLGVRLFVRTTRSVTLTDAGHELWEQGLPAFEKLRRAIENTQERDQKIRGTLRLNLPEIAYEVCLADRLAEFYATYPDISLDLTLSDQMVSVAAEGFHAGIRFGHRLHDEVIAAQISPPHRTVVLGSSDYFQDHGVPQVPQDLVAHDCLQYRFVDSRRTAEWRFQIDGEVQVQPVSGSLTSSSLGVLVDRARRGHGLILTSDQLVARELASGELVAALSEFTYEYPALYIYYPKDYRGHPCLRAFVGFFRTGEGGP
ncbi:LysR family transcriptional regulator [Pseudovibrio exalbescens]|uniref:LysR family transcriptional regulator n=1 Tax=Pseudovibrio exalbescens TaxID=197461 RepID=UPI002366E513|nr:LysR family transcriptional regulator [Pseudovibrio exalbescens]MDD7911484.1 LysR family transcriptional regulator [Pseudovibrio exalbescens]